MLIPLVSCCVNAVGTWSEVFPKKGNPDGAVGVEPLTRVFLARLFSFSGGYIYYI